ncbi:hypothetical protein ACQRIU_005923 [Beauveria bassiana]
MRGAATVTSPSELVVPAEGRLLAQQIEAEPVVRALALLTGRVRLHYGSGMLLLEGRGQDMHDKEYESNNSFARFSLHLGRNAQNTGNRHFTGSDKLMREKLDVSGN